MTGLNSESEPLDVSMLLQQRAQLQRWLDALSAEASDVPGRVAARVRSDYEARLQQVVGELAAHQDALRADVERLREASEQATRVYEDAADELEEARLRHRIGELDDATWGSRRATLERAVEDAEVQRREVGTELERLEQLLDDFSAPEPASQFPEPGDLSSPAGEPTGEAAGGIPELPQHFEPLEPADVAEQAEVAEVPEVAEATDTAPTDDDLEFLAGIDRAISVAGAPGEEALEADTRPKVGVRCPECGYTNDSTAWYCGVCGVDLA